ncbi:MAG: hypothetical protein AB1467_03640 [Candidatus Diapherotrites archaeon]
MDKRIILSASGLLLALFGIIQAVRFHSGFWYTYFIVGAWLFFDCYDFRLRGTSILSLLLEKKFKEFFKLFFFFFAFGLLLDLIYGRFLGKFWLYPNFSYPLNYIYPAFIFYTFGAFAIYELYYFLEFFLRKKLSENRKKKKLKEETKKRISDSLIAILFISIIAPIISFAFFSSAFIREIIFAGMVADIFAFDAVVFKRHGQSLLFEMLEGNKKILLLIIMTWIINFLLHEIPNTFAREWVYRNIPLSGAQFAGLPLLIFWGWLFLTVNIVAVVNIFTGTKKQH